MKHRWIGAWALQIAAMMAAALMTALSQEAGGLVRGLMLWGVMPLAGLWSACRAVRRGLNNYVAWLAPAPCLYAANRLVWGFSPPAGPALLTAFASLVGAAAGEVLERRGTGRRPKRHKRR